MEIINVPEGLQSKLCILGEDVLGEVPGVVKRFWPGREVVIIADENTWEVAGKKVYALLSESGIALSQPKIFPRKPMLHADYEHVAELVPVVSGKTAVAVGSGTINDLTKRAVFEVNGNGYLCVATACSVDGYTAYGAAISVNNFKQTMECPAPLAIIADSKVLSSAPKDMTASGYADLAAKIVAGGDWYVADAMGETPFDDYVWGMVQNDLRSWLACPEKLLENDPERLAALFKGLASTGFAIQKYKESRPASGAEHLFSHVWEMDGVKKDGVSPSHGFKVGVGTLISTALMEFAFNVMTKEDFAASCRKSPEISIAQRQAEIDSYLKGTPIYDNVCNICIGKLLTGEKLARRRSLIVEKWEYLKENVLKQIFTFDDMKARLQCLNCPVKAIDIGVDKDELFRGITVAAMIRKRYTIMDFLFEAGLYGQATDYAASKVL